MHSRIHGHRFPCRDLFFNDLNLSKLVSISKSLDIFISFAVLIIVNSQQIIPECLKTIIKFYITSHGFCGQQFGEGSRNGFSSLLSCQRLQLERLEGCDLSTAGGWIIQRYFHWYLWQSMLGVLTWAVSWNIYTWVLPVGFLTAWVARFWKQMFPESLLKFFTVFIT